MKDAKNALSEIYLRLRLLSRDGMKPETAAWLDKATKVAKEALGDDAKEAEPSGFEKFLTVADGVQFVRFAGKDEVKLVARRKAKSGCPNTIFEIIVDKAERLATVWRDGRILFEVKGVTLGYNRVEAMAVSALKRWFRDLRKNNAQRRRKREARLAAAEKAKEV